MPFVSIEAPRMRTLRTLMDTMPSLMGDTFSLIAKWAEHRKAGRVGETPVVAIVALVHPQVDPLRITVSRDFLDSMVAYNLAVQVPVMAVMIAPSIDHESPTSTRATVVRTVIIRTIVTIVPASMAPPIITTMVVDVTLEAVLAVNTSFVWVAHPQVVATVTLTVVFARECTAPTVAASRAAFEVTTTATTAAVAATETNTPLRDQCEIPDAEESPCP